MVSIQAFFCRHVDICRSSFISILWPTFLSNFGDFFRRLFCRFFCQSLGRISGDIFVDFFPAFLPSFYELFCRLFVMGVFNKDFLWCLMQCLSICRVSEISFFRRKVKWRFLSFLLYSLPIPGLVKALDFQTICPHCNPSGRNDIIESYFRLGLDYTQILF